MDIGDQSWTEISAILLPPPSAVWQQPSIKTSHGLSAERRKIDFAQLRGLVCLSGKALADHELLLTGRLPECAAVVAAVNPAPDRHCGEVHEPLVLHTD